MKMLFDRHLIDSRSAAEVLFKPLDAGGGELNFVNVGAHNGSYLLPADVAHRSLKAVGMR